MKFDYCIGNPPYQSNTLGDNDKFAPSVFNYFMDAAYTVADKVELITPAKFLFNAGSTPKAWNKKMLNDNHLKLLRYERNSTTIFPKPIDIKGGVAITYRSANENLGGIGNFTPYKELNTIQVKVVNRGDFVSFDVLVSGRTPYLFTDDMHRDYPDAESKLSKGHKYDISSNVFYRLPEVFLSLCPYDKDEFYEIVGRNNNVRVNKYIKKIYVRGRKAEYCSGYKVFLPRANGSGAIGEVFSTPIVGTPLMVATDTFLVFGHYDNRDEAENLMKYIKTKFARSLLSVLKVTQNNSKDTWRYVPLQDFTSSSDIDWNQSISDIDKQLYEKYGLSQNEIDFIETHVKEMN